MNARKIATSLPADQFHALETTRRRLKLRRSEAVQQALSLWLAGREEDERVRRYVAGYQARPEDKGSARAYAAAWATGQEPEDW